MLVESALVAAAACAIGLIFAMFAAPAVVSMLATADDPVLLDLRVDWRLVGVISGMTVVITALFGLAPALRASSVEPMIALKAGGGRGSARAGTVRPFLVAQVAFSLIVLFVGGLLVRSFVKLSNVNPGFATSDVWLVSWEATHSLEPPQQRAAMLQVLDRLRAVPGVAAASAAEFNALSRPWVNTLKLPGSTRETLDAAIWPVAPGFFETMKIPLRTGRTFVRADLNIDAPTIVIVNDSFVRKFFGGEPAVGRQIAAGFGKEHATNEIVGVVADTRYDLRKAPAPTIYILSPIQSMGTLHVRVAGDGNARRWRPRCARK
jgi:putative ABC transport system permease protein